MLNRVARRCRLFQIEAIKSAFSVPGVMTPTSIVALTARGGDVETPPCGKTGEPCVADLGGGVVDFIGPVVRWRASVVGQLSHISLLGIDI